MTELVGERSSLCTSGLNWGIRTQWVYSESGDCMPPDPQPGGAWGGGHCMCCSDGDGNGTCDPWEEATWHTCSAAMNCF